MLFRKTKSQPNEIPDIALLEQELNREKSKKIYKRAVRTTIYSMIVAAATAVLIAVYFLPVFRIYGTSMTPTLSEGDVVVAVSVKQFQAGDLVGFYHGNKLLVKRCIAGPGEKVDIRSNGDVYVDGEKLEEPYIQDKSAGDCDLTLPYQVPDEKWFFMGDHRETSLDSRVSAIGCISEDQIKGKVIFRIWPLSKLGFVE
ncbi:MAG TPA: signal peptidase I [Ruminococcaceae bacterium]|nr:signal peptidase I [Oscillospiraceae bacterium]